jgi:transposase
MARLIEIRGCDAAVRLTARRDRSAAIVADLFKLWETELPRISGKSKLAEAICHVHLRRRTKSRNSTASGFGLRPVGIGLTRQ